MDSINFHYFFQYLRLFIKIIIMRSLIDKFYGFCHLWIGILNVFLANLCQVLFISIFLGLLEYGCSIKFANILSIDLKLRKMMNGISLFSDFCRHPFHPNLLSLLSLQYSQACYLLKFIAILKEEQPHSY